MTARNPVDSSAARALIRACDAVFGLTMLVIAAAGTWLYATARADGGTVIALWLIPAASFGIGAALRGRSRVGADLARALVCLPLTAYLYGAESGVLGEMWIPALVSAVGISASLGIETRSARLGIGVSLAYAASLILSVLHHAGVVDPSTLDDVLGILVTGLIMSLVAAKLGRTLDETTRQRDEAQDQRRRAEAALDKLTDAIGKLHAEMELRTRVEAELHEAQKLESVGRLAAGIAHEINTPVQYVSDSIQFVQDAVGELLHVAKNLDDAQVAPDDLDVDLPYLEENVPKALDRAVDGLQRVARIVRSMRELSHPGTSAMAPASLERLVESTLTIANNEVKYVADVATELSDIGPVWCHAGELGQALLNIVVNAAHAIGDANAGTERRGTIRIRTWLDAGDAVIAIADDGPGIPEAARPRIFEPFFTTKEVGRGTGQGLAIARAVVVDKHNGKLTFETEAGRGTTFYIRLPQPAPGAAAA